MTKFEQAQVQVKQGELKTPKVSTAHGSVDYFSYQLAVHHFNLKLMSRGMTCKGIKFKDIKDYYGLKGRTAKDCLVQYEQIMQDYKSRVK